MARNEYQFTSDWRVCGTPEDVYGILEDPTKLPRWWPAVYLDVTELEGTTAGDSVYDLHTTGWLPYTLRWQAIPGERNCPQRIELGARGDLVGRGVWTITADGPWTEITYDWQVCTNKPLLRWFSWLIRPIFAANHRWAMKKGEESLRRELARRRAPIENAQRPAPPQPTPTSFLSLVAGLLLVIVVVYGIGRLRSANWSINTRRQKPPGKETSRNGDATQWTSPAPVFAEQRDAPTG
jgi:hypothetical protein